jgi:hypothetical protein
MTTLVDCPHPRAGHRHGTHLAYFKDHCRCAPCTRAGRIHSKRVGYRTLTGTHTYVDATDARAHVEQLLEVLTVGQIEQRSSVHRTAIRVLVGDFPGRPASKRITRTTRDALLAVRPDRVGPEASGLVDRSGTQRRLRALIALGWTARHLTRRLGMSSRTMGMLTADHGTPILASTRAKVAALYDELALVVPAPSRGTTVARGIAHGRGWVPPLAWDDDTIDDPDALPDTARPAARRSSEELVEDYLDTMWEHRGDVRSAAVRLGVSLGSLEQALRRARRDGADVTFGRVAS